MAFSGDVPSPRRDHWRFLLPLLAVALLVRLYFFNGISLADDVNYWTQAIATGLHSEWPPLKLHWNLRLGIVLPSALLLKLFGLKPWVPYVFTLAGGLLEVVLTYFIARRFVAESTARLAAWLCVFFPLNILYSSYLYVDLWAGILSALSIYYWYRALAEDQRRDYALASLFFGVAWLFRETILMCLPIFVALWVQSRRRPGRNFLCVLPPALLILAGEALLYHLCAGNWHYREDAIFESRGQLYADQEGARGFWVAPFIELVTSHELGLFTLGAMIITVFFYRKIPRPFGLWLLAGFIWLCWGTTVPVAWLPLQGDPRYLTVLTIPTLIVLAVYLNGLPSPFWRRTIVAILVLSGVIGAAADIGKVKLSAHRRLALSAYNRPDTAVEPFVYFGARAAQDFTTNGINFALATGLGRATARRHIQLLPDTRILPITNAHYIVISAQMQPEKWEAKVKAGWRTVEVIRGDTRPVRDLAVRLLTFAGQPTRRLPVVKRPSLVVMENPAFATTNSPAPLPIAAVALTDISNSAAPPPLKLPATN